VGQSGTNPAPVAYSNDGITWNNISTSTNLFSIGYDIAYNGKIFVAVGTGPNKICYSNDGLTWIGLGNPMGTFAVSGIAWNNQGWVAVGDASFVGDSIAYSSNGISWTNISTSTNIFSYGNNICWDGKRWIAVGGGPNTIATSYDGITWYGVATSTSLFSTGYGLSTTYNASSSQLVVSNTSGTTLSNRLEIVADSYYNQGPTELTVSITSNNL
jgi:hypothetical protein